MHGSTFTNISRLLQLSGWNVWDARIETRRLLDIRYPHDKLAGRPPHLSRKFTWYSPESIPTDYERLEIDFWAIVSDLRAILSGNLLPRPWNEISSTWTDGIINPPIHKHDEAKENMRIAARQRYERELKTRTHGGGFRPQSKEERRFRNILRMSGKTLPEANRIAHDCFHN